jgi:prepilin-type N-terminal cleavage/methylation domain-containing protein
MNKQKGFTLVEAAVAIGVVAILSGIIIPLVLKSIRSSRQARARNDIMVIAGAIASQLKDMGARPRGQVVGGADGRAQAVWYSGGEVPGVAGGAGLPAAGNQRFSRLFTATPADGNAVFGLGNPAPGSEVRYKGPYLSDDMTEKTDPWGNAYVILGYNATGQANDGPIWVVSAGEGRTIANVNLRPAGGGIDPGQEWDYRNGSESNIAMRVH